MSVLASYGPRLQEAGNGREPRARFRLPAHLFASRLLWAPLPLMFLI